MNHTHIHPIIIRAVFCFVWFVFGTSTSLATPGRRNIHADPVKPDQARQVIEGRAGAVETFGISGVGTGTRITELARGLKNDPNLIYKFVRDNIEYTPSLRLYKGAGDDVAG